MSEHGNFPAYDAFYRDHIPRVSEIITIEAAGSQTLLGELTAGRTGFITKATIVNDSGGLVQVRFGTFVSLTWAQKILDKTVPGGGYSNDYGPEDFPIGPNAEFATDIYARVVFPGGTPATVSVRVQIEWVERPGPQG